MDIVNTGYVVYLLGIYFLLLALKPSSAISMRKIYTLHADAGTWNEAKQVCETNLGRLLKLKGIKELEELLFLDSTESESGWNGRLNGFLSTNGVWTGLHQPYVGVGGNASWEYDDCEPQSADLSVSSTNGSHCGALLGTSLAVTGVACSSRRPFVCERYIGDCWFQPYPKQMGMIQSAQDVQVLDPGLTLSDCAVTCRNTLHHGSECWGFYYTRETDSCFLLCPNMTAVSSRFERAAHRIPYGGPEEDWVFYVRRCFEGTVDNNPSSVTVDSTALPVTKCTTEVFNGNDTAGEVCFCTTQQRPVIPPSITSEEAAARYAEELSLDARNTSANFRSKNSAVDNRPMAVGMGATLGAGLLAFVFGAVFLMDLPVLYRTLKERLCCKPKVRARESRA
ncbi:uncharacterized protein LOC127856881 [Dreissena polymorpha]|uniref:C-type lectin domain-containing protein n=1 Tax=Dreissena polymorpha TaxID=45954 RepID=A0A9D3Z0S0_DREPO|nr:uncharacterized protein LOC127856881 [Dreissena polymorpha]KAH3708014.1 hypothetical protein DPMN_067453 [Dreissena polymorpha]